MTERVVTNQTTIRFAAELAKFLLVDLLEQRALIPGRAFEFLDRLAEFFLGNRHESNLQHLVRLGIVDEVMETAPCAFQLLKVLMVQNLVDLFGHFEIDLRNDRVDGIDRVIKDQILVAQHLVCQRFDGSFHLRACSIRLGLEFLVQKFGELIDS